MLTQAQEILSQQGTHSGDTVIRRPAAAKPSRSRVADSLGPLLGSRGSLRAMVPHPGEGRGHGPQELRSTRSTSSSPSSSFQTQGITSQSDDVSEMGLYLCGMHTHSFHLHLSCDERERHWRRAECLSPDPTHLWDFVQLQKCSYLS